MLRSRYMLVAFMSSIACTAQCADDVESLDEDFLAYLAEFENDEDDWTIVEPTAPPPTAAKPVSTPSPSATKTPTPTVPTPRPTPATPDDGSKP